MPVFQYKCKETDYRLWSPSDALNNWKCLLGRKDTYERRIPHANCYNGIDYDRPISTENCPCIVEDYECDFGFKKNSQDKTCSKDKTDIVNPFAIPNNCQPGESYNLTKGYRKIPGDTCQGGHDYIYEPELTPCPLK